MCTLEKVQDGGDADQDADLTPSHKNTEIYTYIESNLSLEKKIRAD